MTSRIPGVLDTSALARLHFHALDCEQQREAIARLAASGMSADGISHATGLAVEQIRRVLEPSAEGTQ